MLNMGDHPYIIKKMDVLHHVRFYHRTMCKICTKEDIHINTHRTDFVGYEHANRFFNIISRKIMFNDGIARNIYNDMEKLRDLATQLMRKQGVHFFLNEYPEECDHRAFIDLDANVSDDVLTRIIYSLQELTTRGEVQVLRNTISGKVHLIMDAPAYSMRGSLRKRAISEWMGDYLYEAALLEDDYTKQQWRDDIFDAKAPGIRSAFSVKVKDGKLESAGVYVPVGCDVAALSLEEKVNILCEYSIYAHPSSNWTADTLEAFEEAENELRTRRATIADKYRIVSEYDAEKRSIHFLGTDCAVNGALINEFIHLVPKLWTGKRHWGIMLRHVKCAAMLAKDFDPAYFLHEWSARSKELYNKDGNDNQYARCQVNQETAGESLTWLRNMAARGFTADSNLSRGDMGLAEIFAAKVSDNIKIVRDDATCYLWDDSKRLWMLRNNRWIGCEVSKHLEKVINSRIKLLKGMHIIDVEPEMKECRKKKEKVLSHRGSMDIVNKAFPLLEDKDFITKINLQPDLLPICGGLVINLRTGETSPRLPEHNFTFECPVSIDRDANKLIIVEQFMLDICCGDRDLLNYMQVALGYCITGRINEKAVFVWWGENGDNGKSTLMNLLKAVLGVYCKSASKSVFIKTNSDSKLTPEREVLKDSRMVMFSETTADDALNDEVLKMASGDDPIRVNPKYQAEYEFRSYAKLLIATNHKPKINVSDAAMVRRVKFIPFLAKFVQNPKASHERLRDVQLAARMESDLLDAFFTWILDGAMKWYASGLNDIPTVMRKETEAYIQENDEIGEFLADTITEEKNQYVLSSVLFTRYLEWCRGRNSTPKGSKTFAQDTGKRYEKVRKKVGFVYIGIRFKTLADGDGEVADV
jgi:P4 family phage/plasmid primase-like protien